MQVEYKKLDSGYHYAKAVGRAHLFVQWPPGAHPTCFDVSYGECHPGPTAIRELCEAAYQESLTSAEKLESVG